MLAVAGVIALSYCVAATVEAHAAQQSTESIRTLAQDETRGSVTPGAVMGNIRIPALKLTAPITKGIESISLIRGVGHIPGTALPGGLGTMALAGHRDTFFRGLGRIKPDMLILVRDASGSYTYSVDRTEIVTPDQVRVLDIVERPQLVLVTCYPFEFIGAAPKRFIVHAHLVSVLANGV